MANAEQLFNSSTLGLIVPDVVLDLPALDENTGVDEWLGAAEKAGERQKVFFGTQFINSILKRTLICLARREVGLLLYLAIAGPDR